ncbi:MAG TPA: PASTA domain-containing protein [Magnetospirillaceae bacterium]|nr:PASTA domain-containing protein [Magnetospirillaceae bacterium]
MKLHLDIRRIEELDPVAHKFTLLVLAGVIVLMAVSGLIAFFLVLQGAEQTMVPDVEGLELTTALIKMQEKELYPRIALRFSSDPADRGRILEQSPPAGAIVKAGRRIQLAVSRGPAVTQVENFVGQTLDEVKIHLQTVFSSAHPLLQVREPPMHIFDRAPAGTILEQKPMPGTEISGLTELVFVVSRGPEVARVRVPDLRGLSITDAVRRIEDSGIAFTFSMRPPEGRERPGVVVSQTPAAGALIAQDSPVTVLVSRPAAVRGFVSGLLEEQLTVFPYMLEITLTAEHPTGEKVVLLSAQHPGGPFAAPFTVPENSVLVLTAANREILRRTIRPE